MSERMVKWESRHELCDTLTGDTASVVKWSDRLRKQAALCVCTGTQVNLVAYFKDEEIARDFCERFLGGVIGDE